MDRACVVSLNVTLDCSVIDEPPNALFQAFLRYLISEMVLILLFLRTVTAFLIKVMH